MNHGKSNPPVVFCPNCGEKFTQGSHIKTLCDEEKHKSRRKERNLFCHDCGQDLKK